MKWKNNIKFFLPIIALLISTGFLLKQNIDLKSAFYRAAVRDINQLSLALSSKDEDKQVIIKNSLATKVLYTILADSNSLSEDRQTLCAIRQSFEVETDQASKAIDQAIIPMLQLFKDRHDVEISDGDCREAKSSTETIRKPNFEAIDRALKQGE